MNNEFNDCLNNRKITKFERADRLVQKEMDLAESDLKSASESFKANNYKWATIQAYYSMFHSARALLYFKGYKERGHYCLIIAIRALYVEKRLLSNKLVESLQLGKTLRENADYQGDFSKLSARNITSDAKEFLDVSRKIIKS